MHIRPFRPEEDLPAVLAFLQSVERETGIAPLGESKYVDLRGPGLGSGLIGGDGEILAYAHVLDHPASELTEMELVAAAHSSDGDLAAMVTAVLGLTPRRLLWWTFGETRAARFAAPRLGVHRRLHKLVGALPLTESRPETGDGRVAPFRPDIDDDAWLEVNNAAFHGHPENGGWSRSDLAKRLSLDWFDAEGFRLWWVGERLAGFCWTKRHDGVTGEIYVIGVHPDFQRKGLGRQIVVEALWYLADVGCTTALLYVDTVNQSALRLYQSLGFELARVDRCFVVPKVWPHEVQ
ncbi:MAG: mycothiol synthase [Acidimicrobiia bacterium]|nr:mycothiol synthase [Acidimicrobiia bacterium]